MSVTAQAPPAGSATGSLSTGSQDQLVLLLSQLSSHMKENTRVLRRLEAGIKQKGADEEDLDERRDKVLVELRVAYLRILDIDTVAQHYNAEIYLQAKWTEPALHGISQDELDDMDLSKYWDPRVLVANIDGELDDNRVWRQAAIEHGYQYPVVYYKRRMRGRFTETLELRDFPVDVQELTLSISTFRSSREVEFAEDRFEMSEVFSDTLTDTQEWNLYSHVELTKSHVRRGRDQKSVNADAAHPRVDVTCHVARKPGFFLWNVILIMFLIVSLVFTSFSIDAGRPQSRLGVTLTLLLTTVAFKFVVVRNLPTISYLTYLDVYVLGGLILLVTVAVQNAVVSLFTTETEYNTNTSRKIDQAFMIAVGCLFILFHLFFICFIVQNVRSKRKEFSKRDKEYQEKREVASRYIRGIDVDDAQHQRLKKKRVYPSPSKHQTPRSTRLNNTTSTYTVTPRDGGTRDMGTRDTFPVPQHLPPPTEAGVYEVPVDDPPEKVMVPEGGRLKRDQARVPRKKSTRRKRDRDEVEEPAEEEREEHAHHNQLRNSGLI